MAKWQLQVWQELPARGEMSLRGVPTSPTALVRAALRRKHDARRVRRVE